jgi:hypothetical protein
VVDLEPGEFLHACLVGCTREIDNLRAKRQDRYGAEASDGWCKHVQGACGEKVLAKYLGRYWTGSLGNLQARDVAGYQVRASARWDASLILHDGDADEHTFVLVTGSGPRFCLRGWIVGRDGKQRRWWKDPQGGRPGYFVPQSALQLMSKLAGGS